MTIARATELYILTMFEEVRIKNECSYIDSDVSDALCDATSTILAMFHTEITADIQAGNLDALKAVIAHVLSEHGKAFDDGRCYSYLYDALYYTLFR